MEIKLSTSNKNVVKAKKRNFNLRFIAADIQRGAEFTHLAPTLSIAFSLLTDHSYSSEPQHLRYEAAAVNSTKKAKNDASTRPPNLSSASYDLDVWSPDPLLIVPCLCLWTTCAKLRQTRFIRYQNIVLTSVRGN